MSQGVSRITESESGVVLKYENKHVQIYPDKPKEWPELMNHYI